MRHTSPGRCQFFVLNHLTLYVVDIAAPAVIGEAPWRPDNPSRSPAMKRIRQYVELARRRHEVNRISQVVALPLAGFVAISSVQLLLVSASGELSLRAAAPMIWISLCFAGMLAVFMTWFQR